MCGEDEVAGLENSSLRDSITRSCARRAPRLEFYSTTTVPDREGEVSLLSGLIVVGSHGRKGLDRFRLGSLAESVARHACCLVLILRIPPST